MRGFLLRSEIESLWLAFPYHHFILLYQIPCSIYKILPFPFLSLSLISHISRIRKNLSVIGRGKQGLNLTEDLVRNI